MEKGGEREGKAEGEGREKGRRHKEIHVLRFTTKLTILATADR